MVPELYIGNSGININNKSAWLSFKDKIHFYKDGTATIGGWTIGTSSLSCANTDTKKQDYTRWLYFGTTNSAKLMWTDNKEKSVALRLGNGFGVTTDGKLYASGADIQGKFNISSESILNGTEVNKIKSATITSTPTDIALKVYNTTTTVNGKTTTLASYLDLHDDNISAKVSKDIDGTDADESMSWNLKSNSFVIKANGS